MDPAERKAKAVEALAGCRITARKKKSKPGRKVSSFLKVEEPSGRKVYMMCKRKHRYRTQADATRHMHVLMTIRPEQPLRCYLCPYCGFYHLTHRTEKKGRPKRVRFRKSRGCKKRK